MLICFDHRTGSGCGHQNRDGARHCNQCGLTLRFALQLQDPGATIGRYTIVRVIGHGGAGAVYEAAGAGRPAALKETFDPQGVRSLQGEFEVGVQPGPGPARLSGGAGGGRRGSGLGRAGAGGQHAGLAPLSLARGGGPG